LQLDAFDQLGRRGYGTIAVVRDRALVASRLAAAARVDQVPHDAREPGPQRSVGIRLLLGGDEPRILRDVFGECAVLDQRARELADQGPFGHQLLAGWDSRVFHRYVHPLTAAARRIVRDNLTGATRANARSPGGAARSHRRARRSRARARVWQRSQAA